MKVVFFSSSTYTYDAASFHYTAYPANADRLEELAARHPEHEFAVVARLPAFFLVDLENDGSFTRKARGMEYVLLPAAGSLSKAAPADLTASASKVCAPACASQAACADGLLSGSECADGLLSGSECADGLLSGSECADKTTAAFKTCGAACAFQAQCADQTASASKAFAAAVAALAPDLAIAATCWMTPFDWLPLEDALIAAELEAAGIRTLCHSPASAETCFDKRQMRGFLKARGIPAPESLFLDHSLFWAGRGRSEITINPYKELLFSRLEKLHFPCVIKDTTGLSSYGLDVVNSPKAARSILESRKTSGDRLIEEYIAGDQFGVEVYGTPGHYQVMTPFLFSVTQYGITSPKQSVKLSVSGDEAEVRFKLADMRRLVTDLAEALELRGAAQFDLVFSGASGLESGLLPSPAVSSDENTARSYGGWYLIEVNPRLSGLTVPTAVLSGASALEQLFVAALSEHTGAEGQIAAAEHSLDERAPGLESKERPAFAASLEKNGAPACVLDVKLTVLALARLEELCALPYVYAVNQTANDGARQNRERGYCEVVLGAESAEVLLSRLADLKARFPDELDDVFLEAARTLALRACRGLVGQTACCAPSSPLP